MAAARQRDVGGSLAAVRWQWQRQRWGRQGDSATSADRDVSGSLAAARRRRQRQRQRSGGLCVYGGWKVMQGG